MKTKRVWRRFEGKRGLRDLASLIPAELLDEIDWREAEQKFASLDVRARL
jgi:hypothetical protein